MSSAFYDLIYMRTGVCKFRLEHFKTRVVQGGMIPYEYVLEFDQDIDIPFAYHWRDKLACLQEAVKMQRRLQNG